jgi:hypothetical protein
LPNSPRHNPDLVVLHATDEILALRREVLDLRRYLSTFHEIALACSNNCQAFGHLSHEKEILHLYLHDKQPNQELTSA